MSKVNPLRDEKTGRFLPTTNSTRYKRVQFNGKSMNEHQRVMCIALNIPEIPKGLVVHHLDQDKKNNDLDNLALITITAHNRIHAHKAWNKGIKTSKETLFKQRVSTDNHYLKVFKKTFDLCQTGLTQKEVAKKLNVSKATIALRIKRYKELKEKYE